VSALATPQVRVVLDNAAAPDPAARAALLRSLLDAGYAVACLAAGEEGPPDALRLGAAEVAGLDAAAVVARVEQRREQAQVPRPGAWKPWFPVIDYARCTNCMQCLSFCLFDVYGSTPEGKIQVRNQDNCKTDCPACSRVCPEVAILFPKYRFGPINGDEVRADDVRREAMKVDISALLGGDVYALLRDRSAKARSRFSKERDEERALKERKTCLVKLQQEAPLEIPAEVLAALPSPDEIRARAEAAQERARAALAAAAASGGQPAPGERQP
jgi:Pyruvate/2-oxoacid:ferredoxin oxidoreductase delta subunit